MSKESIETARGFLQAFNDADWDRLGQSFTPDAVYDEDGSGRRADGRQQIVAMFQGWKRAWPDGQGVITNAIASDDGAVLEITWNGTHTGPLATPQGEIPPTGKTWSAPTCFVCNLQGNTIKDSRMYFNLTSLLQQLGLVPEAATA